MAALHSGLLLQSYCGTILQTSACRGVVSYPVWVSPVFPLLLCESTSLSFLFFHTQTPFRAVGVPAPLTCFSACFPIHFIDQIVNRSQDGVGHVGVEVMHIWKSVCVFFWLSQMSWEPGNLSVTFIEKLSCFTENEGHPRLPGGGIHDKPFFLTRSVLFLACH